MGQFLVARGQLLIAGRQFLIAVVQLAMVRAVRMALGIELGAQPVELRLPFALGVPLRLESGRRRLEFLLSCREVAVSLGQLGAKLLELAALLVERRVMPLGRLPLAVEFRRERFQFLLPAVELTVSLGQLGPWATKLRTLMTSDLDGTLWLPFTWNDPDQKLTAPWYNGLGAGSALALYVRLARITGDPQWMETADGLFGSFVKLGPSKKRPWGSRCSVRPSVYRNSTSPGSTPRAAIAASTPRGSGFVAPTSHDVTITSSRL